MSTYFAILTQVGEAKLANAIALGQTLKLKKMGVGDGNGALPIPDRLQKALVHEVRRADLNQLAIDPANASQIIVEQVLPEDVGGWWLREIGIYDEAGDLCAVANCPPSYKPLMVEGSGRTQVVRVVLIVASTAAIELKIDPAIILATRKYVDDRDIVVRSYADGQMAAHEAAADPHPQYSMRTVATLPKFDASTKLANAEFVQQAQGNMVDARPINDSRKLKADDIGCALYFTTPGQRVTIPSPEALGIPYNSGKCVKFFGLLYGGEIVPDAGVIIGFDVFSAPKVTLKTGQFFTLLATRSNVWQVIDSTAEMSRNADFDARLGSAQGIGDYQILPSGNISQWGTTTSTATGSAVIALPFAFPRALLSIALVPLSTVAMYCTANAETRSGFTINIWTASGTPAPAGISVNWRVIGY